MMLQFGASLTDDTNIVIYDNIVFMIQATDHMATYMLAYWPASVIEVL
jgi:hypothetical protein